MMGNPLDQRTEGMIGIPNENFISNEQTLWSSQEASAFSDGLME